MEEKEEGEEEEEKDDDDNHEDLDSGDYDDDHSDGNDFVDGDMKSLTLKFRNMLLEDIVLNDC